MTMSDSNISDHFPLHAMGGRVGQPWSAGTVYRKPELKDLPKLAEIYNHAICETAATFDTKKKPPEYFQHFIPGNQLHRMLVAEYGGEVIGYGGTYAFSQREAYSQFAELMLYVHPDWQKKGVGAALLSKIHTSSFLAGLFTILALVNQENTHMHRMLEQLGYVYKGELTDIALKFEKRHSLVIYQANVDELTKGDNYHY